VTPAGLSWIVGTVPYKGFFEIKLAGAEALDLRRKGPDVCVAPVSAYRLG
jgi:predicted aminopeptidase